MKRFGALLLALVLVMPAVFAAGCVYDGYYLRDDGGEERERHEREERERRESEERGSLVIDGTVVG
ncbi:MAG TPA: hypothetical protein ENJ37_00880 [Deltaproteobacteria bacterium]|nr:hypothetical protein [Deltaproteobacteria bacterium]